jgi:uncharacterized protein (DUF952 family)
MLSKRVKTIYKIATETLWWAASETGIFHGSEVDIADGFIHFSTRTQVRDTAEKHFAGQTGLVLVAVDANRLHDALRWEPSRGGDLFPHLYAPLPVHVAIWIKPLPLGSDGRHMWPELPADD